MALFKLVCWAIIFLTKLRFPPGCSIATILTVYGNITNQKMTDEMRYSRQSGIPQQARQDDITNSAKTSKFIPLSQ